MTTDPAALRFNQFCIVFLSALGLVFAQPWLVLLTATVMLLGSLLPRLALFKRFFTDLLRPALGLPKRLVEDDPRSHTFAQTLGGVFLALASLAFVGGLSALGAILTLLVILLALLNLTTGYCVGCQLYFHFKLLRYRWSR